MNQNKSALDRLKEIEAEREELIGAIESEMEEARFPVYMKWRSIYFYKLLSKTDQVAVRLGSHCDPSVESSTNNVHVNCVAWQRFIADDFNPITREEFEAARAEAINKLSNL